MLQNCEVVCLFLGGDIRVWKDWQKDLLVEVVLLLGCEFMVVSVEYGEIIVCMEILYIFGVLFLMCVLFDGQVYVICVVFLDVIVWQWLMLMVDVGVVDG